MISKRLKELDIKIAELASYIKVSRPTLYKFIESYDLNNRKSIKKEVLDLFDFIENNELIGKLNVIDYIFSHFATAPSLEGSNLTVKKKIINMISNDEIPKDKLTSVSLILSSNDYDQYLLYIVKINKLLNKKGTLSDEEKKLLEDFKTIVSTINSALKGDR